MPGGAAMPAAQARASEIRRLGHAVVQIEAAAAEAVADAVDERFVEAADLILSCTGRVICTGVGKPG